MPTIIIYGYEEHEATQLQHDLGALLESDISLISATGQENATVIEIIEKQPKNIFATHPFKALVFVDFEEDEIEKTVYNFPKSVSRPIFCGLTPDNVKWPFGHLLEHLLEEYRQWQREKKT